MICQFKRGFVVKSFGGKTINNICCSSNGDLLLRALEGRRLIIMLQLKRDLSNIYVFGNLE
jgi:hypothetical protein